MRILICGGGVIGASIAYFLSRRGVRSTVVERTGVACAASGKSGGFLALDWCDGTPLEHLARRSFALHARLAEEINADWGYRRLTTYAGFAAAQGAQRRRADPYDIDWVSDNVRLGQRLGSSETTAQVHPGRFTEALMRAAQARGAELRLGCVTGIARAGSGASVSAVEVDGEVIEGDAVVIAMGPWSILAAGWVALPAVFGLKGHSLVFETETKIAAEALFLEYREASGIVHSPEVFPRADGTTYVCAISSESPLPLDPAEVAPDPGAIERLEAICARLSPTLAESRILARQACYRPATRDGLPLIGPVPGLDNVYVATGHSVWGILNAPATGEAMVELIVDGAARTIDLSRAFIPAGFRRSIRRGWSGTNSGSSPRTDTAHLSFRRNAAAQVSPALARKSQPLQIADRARREEQSDAKSVGRFFGLEDYASVAHAPQKEIRFLLRGFAELLHAILKGLYQDAVRVPAVG
jgi:glycine/D-amino acid oxidase-like deaminating enzyme